jgi:hypothetical protein
MDWWTALDPGVRQVVVLVAAALAGALFVVIAQTLAVRKTLKTALRQFDQQTTEHRRITEEATHDRRTRAQVAERQHAYARFMSLAWQYERTTTDLRSARRAAENLRDSGVPEEEAMREKDRAVSVAVSEQSRARDELSQAREVVRLLSPAEVRYAADRWFIDLVRDEAAGAQRAKSDFLAHARVDVGADKPGRSIEAARRT